VGAGRRNSCLAAAAVVTCSDEQVAPQCTPLILHGRRTRRRQSISRENETSAVSRACPARLGRNGDRAHRSTVSSTERRQRDEASDCWIAHAQVGAPPPHAPARQTVTPVKVRARLRLGRAAPVRPAGARPPGGRDDLASLALPASRTASGAVDLPVAAVRTRSVAAGAHRVVSAWRRSFLNAPALMTGQ
jgi:hypothetical protein